MQKGGVIGVVSEGSLEGLQGRFGVRPGTAGTAGSGMLSEFFVEVAGQLWGHTDTAGSGLGSQLAQGC